MAWAPPGDPSQKRTTGTTGILQTHYDGYMWQDRIIKEDVVHAVIHNPDGFLMRNAVRQPAIPLPPQRTVPDGGEAAPPDPGWGPSEPRGRELAEAMRNLAAGPRGRHPLPETSQHSSQWSVATYTRPSRCVSLPSLGDAETVIESSRTLVQEAQEKRARRRQEKLAEAEAGISRALARSGNFANHGARGHKYNRPLGSTDATEFQNFFTKSTGGIQLHQTRSSAVPVLRDKSNNLVSAWCP